MHTRCHEVEVEVGPGELSPPGPSRTSSSYLYRLTGNHALGRTPGDSRGELFIWKRPVITNERGWLARGKWADGGGGGSRASRPGSGEVQRSPAGRSATCRGVESTAPKCYLRKSMTGSQPPSVAELLLRLPKDLRDLV